MARRRTRTECVHAPPGIYRGQVLMDWHTHPVDARPGPCRACARPTVLRDCTGARCHKVCAEAEATAELAADRRHVPRRRVA